MPRAPSAARAARARLPGRARAPGISEDVALLLAYEKGAELIVAVGTHFNLIEFLERNRAGMSSTFLTRLQSGRAARRREGRLAAREPRRSACGR